MLYLHCSRSGVAQQLTAVQPFYHGPSGDEQAIFGRTVSQQRVAVFDARALLFSTRAHLRAATHARARNERGASIPSELRRTMARPTVKRSR